MEINSRRIILGSLFVLIGAVLLLDNLDVLDFSIPRYIIRWEMILVILGVINIFNKNYSAAIILLGIGAFFWIADEFNRDIWDLWPIIFIIIGLSFIIKRGGLGKKNIDPANEDYFDDIAIFGGNEKVISSSTFRGGKATSIFGGSTLDLTKCQLASGATVVIDVFTMFGGCEIRVPEDWHVKLEVVTILGGFEDKRRIAETVEESSTLIVKGFTMFGGGEVKN